MSEKFDYYYGEESESCSFYRIPRLLVLGTRFSGLSTDAKLLYGLMLDRMNLSARNGWYDGAGRVYIYYTLEEIQESLRCGHGKAVRLLAELDTEKGIGLIERKKQGQGKPTRIYVKRYTTRAVPPPADFPGEEVKTSENGKSRVPQSGRADFPKGDGNYIDRKQTDVNQLYRSSSSPPGGGRWERERMTEKVRSQVEYGRLCERYEVELIDELVAVITDVLCSTRPTLRVGGELLPAWQVQKRFRLLERDHLEYVIESLQRTTAQVVNVRAYLMTTLYNAPVTIYHYYQAEVQHDLAGG